MPAHNKRFGAMAGVTSNDAHFEMNNRIIYGNVTSKEGGGVYVGNESIQILTKISSTL